MNIFSKLYIEILPKKALWLYGMTFGFREDVKLKITYKELSIVLGIFVAILAIVTYWLNIHPEETSQSNSLIIPSFNNGIEHVTNLINGTLQSYIKQY